MNKFISGVILLLSLSFTKANHGNKISTNLFMQDVLHKVWKFKRLELIKDPSGANRTVSIDNYDLWDLTNKDTLKYTLKDSAEIIHAIPYKIINNTLLLKVPDNEQNLAVRFKITELTDVELKLTMHVTYTIKGKTKDEDIIGLVFEKIVNEYGE